MINEFFRKQTDQFYYEAKSRKMKTNTKIEKFIKSGVIRMSHSEGKLINSIKQKRIKLKALIKKLRNLRKVDSIE